MRLSRTSFALALLSSASLNFIEFAAVLVLFSRVPRVAGWTLWEVALLYALAETTFATAEVVGSALDDFHRRIAEGTFDRVLTRPRGTLFQVLAEDLALRRLGRVAQGALVMALALSHLSLEWTPQKVLVLVGALVSGVAIFFSIFVLAAAFCFWTVEGKEATHVFSYGGGKKTAEMMNVHFLGELPLDPTVRVGGDSGKPVSLQDAPQFAALAREVERRAAEVSQEKRVKIEIED